MISRLVHRGLNTARSFVRAGTPNTVINNPPAPVAAAPVGQNQWIWVGLAAGAAGVLAGVVMAGR